MTHSIAFKHRLHSSYSHPLLRQWHNDSPLLSHDLVFPVFVVESPLHRSEIPSMKGQVRVGSQRLIELLEPLVGLGLRSVILFGTLTSGGSNVKDERASFATSPDSPVVQALRVLKQRLPSLYIIVDVCLCAYTSHGHCGILMSHDEAREDREIDNAASIERISEMALFLARNGADCIAPSDMMDGRIGLIKQRLRENGLEHRVAVCSYAVKFASCFYGPFRDAADSGAQFGDRSKYQLPGSGRSLAMRAAKRDMEEGADMIMVKPGLPYLDLVREVKNIATVPIAVYHVSGEYVMLMAAAESGAFNLEEAVMEVMASFRRAGASMILTYFTPLVLQFLKNRAQLMLVQASSQDS